jgi:hypothetical protein
MNICSLPLQLYRFRSSIEAKIGALRTDRPIVSKRFGITTAALPEGGGAVFVFVPIECLGQGQAGAEDRSPGMSERSWPSAETISNLQWR